MEKHQHRTCGTCEWFMETAPNPRRMIHSGKKGECHGSLPSLPKNQDQRPWPEVNSSDFCASYAKKVLPQKAAA